MLHLAVFATFEGANMNDTQNPIALRSKEWLTNALLELMKNKPFREISISADNNGCKDSDCRNCRTAVLLFQLRIR